MRMRVVNACFAAQRKRHEAPAGRFASTSQLPSTSKRCYRARGKEAQLSVVWETVAVATVAAAVTGAKRWQAKRREFS